MHNVLFLQYAVLKHNRRCCPLSVTHCRKACARPFVCRLSVTRWYCVKTLSLPGSTCLFCCSWSYLVLCLMSTL